jgi:hypothetical protein
MHPQGKYYSILIKWIIKYLYHRHRHQSEYEKIGLKGEKAARIKIEKNKSKWWGAELATSYSRI